MNLYSWFQLIFYITILLLLVKPLGMFMANVYEGRSTFLNRVLGPVERFIYRTAGVDPAEDMNWKTYAIAMLVFNAIGLLTVFALQRFQNVLPLNPQGLGAVTPDSSWNTAVSFATNTNWQGYSGETTMSYLTQMLGTTVQNFVSAATGMAVLVAFIRGLVRSPHFENHKIKGQRGVGNFWVDLTRSTLYILLPLSLVLALALVSQGVVQTFSEYQTVSLIQPSGGVEAQVIAVGPAASQIAIKQIGTNGGGFFNVNSSHPFENPTPFSNLIEMLSILLIPISLCYTFGRMIGDTRQGWALLTVMTVIFVALLGGGGLVGAKRKPCIHSLGHRPNTERYQPRRQHGRQGGSFWHHQLCTVGDGDHCRLERLGQLDARLIHAPGRTRPHGADAAG